jgi:hypothetical protein
MAKDALILPIFHKNFDPTADKPIFKKYGLEPLLLSNEDDRWKAVVL